jgi:triphosphatase
MEIEAKYAILGPLNPATLTSLDLGPYHLYPDGETHHQDVLLDTPTFAITSDGHTLRLRHSEGRVLLTYKGPNLGSDGMHEREEIEIPLETPASTDYQRWPHEIADRIAPLVGDAPLVPLVKLYVHRRKWQVENVGRMIGEMVLDQGIINAGGRTARVHELEVELKGEGERDDLQALGQRLQEQLPLQPQPRGKLQRGLALLRKNRILDGHTPLRTVGMHAIRRHLRRLQHSLPVVREGVDPEGIHDLRVATRRLRTTLQTLEESPVFPQRTVRVLRNRLRGLACAAGKVRDADVLLARVERDLEAQPESAADLAVLHEALRRRQRRARAKLLKRLDGPAFAQLLADFKAFVADKHDETADAPREQVFVRHFAGSAIWRRYEHVLGFEAIVREARPRELHELRIACKRLRYTLELFESELGKGTQPLLKLLSKVQDHLGSLQDTVVLLKLVKSLHEEHPDNVELAIYASTLAGERDRLLSAFGPLWTDLGDAGVSQELAELVAGL